MRCETKPRAWASIGGCETIAQEMERDTCPGFVGNTSDGLSEEFLEAASLIPFGLKAARGGSGATGTPPKQDQ